MRRQVAPVKELLDSDPAMLGTLHWSCLVVRLDEFGHALTLDEPG